MPPRAAPALDLNLLRVFRAVSRTRHATRAAQALGLSQPALSHALGRLRETWGDALFVKTPRGMLPTPLAERLAGPLDEALTKLEEVVRLERDVSLATLERTFRLRATDYVETLLAPRLVRRLAAEAPKARVSFRAADTRLPALELESAATDLAIAGFFREVPSGFRQQVLFRDGYRSAVRAHHPRLAGKARLTRVAFCQESHVLIAPSGELSGAVDAALAKVGATRRVALGSSGFLAACFVAAASDCILTAPARLFDHVAPLLALDVFETPLALPRIKLAQIWHERSHGDRAHRFLRELVFELLHERA